jgi:hypothetical protein
MIVDDDPDRHIWIASVFAGHGVVHLWRGEDIRSYGPHELQQVDLLLLDHDLSEIQEVAAHGGQMVHAPCAPDTWAWDGVDVCQHIVDTLAHGGVATLIHSQSSMENRRKMLGLFPAAWPVAVVPFASLPPNANQILLWARQGRKQWTWEAEGWK